MRYLVYLLTILFVGTAVAQNPTILQGNYITNVFGQANYVKNPNAYIVGSSTTVNPFVTGTNATITRSTTTPLVATAEFTITTSTATGYADWDLRTFDQGMKGQNCEARFTYRGFSVGSTTAQILQGANVVAQLTLTSTTDPRIASINFPCGDLSAVTKFRLQQATAALTGTNEIGGIYVGLATNQANVAQAEVVVLASRTSTQTITTGSYQNVLFNTVAKDQLGEYNTSTGFFTAKRAGVYQINAQVVWVSAAWLATNNVYLAIAKNNDPNTAKIFKSTPAQTATVDHTNSATFDLAVGDTISVQVYQDSGSNKDITGVSGQGITRVQIARFPSSSELVVKPETQNTWAGVQYRGAGGGLGNAVHAGSAAPTGYSAFNNAMWNQPTMLKGKASLATSSNNDLGFSVSNLPVGNYQLSISGFLAANTGAGASAGTRVRCNFRLRETTTSTVIAQQSIQNYVATAGAGTVDTRDYPNSVNGVFSNTSVATRNFILEAQKFSDTGTAGSCEVWSDNTSNTLNTDIFLILTPLDQPSNSALYVQGPVLGAQTGATIPAGYVGEVLSADDGAYQNTTSNQYNVLSLALTPGVWDVSGKCLFNQNSATITTANWIGSITNQNANPSDSMVSWLAGSSFVNATAVAIPTEIVRVRWDGTTNVTPGSTNTSSNLVYIRCFPGVFTGGPVQVWRKIWARRIN